MRDPSTDDILDAMHVLGGSFIQALALAYQRADPTNQQKLRDAFQDEWAHYRDLARLALPKKQA